MKKLVRTSLSDVVLECNPLSQDSEGLLRGGFVGMGGLGAEATTNENCKNNGCKQDHCTNNGCTGDASTNHSDSNNGCVNISCTNNGCIITQTETVTPTDTTVEPKIGLLGLYI